MRDTYRRRGSCSPRRSLLLPRPPWVPRRGQARTASPSGCRPTHRRTTGSRSPQPPTRQFAGKHPGVTVNVQYQTWGDPSAEVRRDARRRQRAGRDRDGEHRDDEVHGGGCLPGPHRRQGVVPELEHLARRASRASGRYDGKTYGVPYYAGSRVVTYRTDLFKKAGIKVPTSLAQFTAAGARLAKEHGKKGFSPVYIAGTDWYFAMSFVFDYGGEHRRRRSAASGRARSSSPKSIAGLTAYKNFFNVASRRPARRTDETHPNPYDVYAQGHAASIIGPAWFTCCVGKHVHARSRASS